MLRQFIPRGIPHPQPPRSLGGSKVSPVVRFRCRAFVPIQYFHLRPPALNDARALMFRGVAFAGFRRGPQPFCVLSASSAPLAGLSPAACAALVSSGLVRSLLILPSFGAGCNAILWIVTLPHLFPPNNSPQQIMVLLSVFSYCSMGFCPFVCFKKVIYICAKHPERLFGCWPYCINPKCFTKYLACRFFAGGIFYFYFYAHVCSASIIATVSPSGASS